MLELQMATKNKRTKNGGEGITALYCRLSVDDNGTEGESNSIKNQRDIFGRYAKQHGYRNIEYYIDDGYSGTNFNRPDFQRMMSDVDEGKVKTIIVKDMSRLGRDYLKVGYLTEFTFAEKDIHFIAINDNVDSENGSFTTFMPRVYKENDNGEPSVVESLPIVRFMRAGLNAEDAWYASEIWTTLNRIRHKSDENKAKLNAFFTKEGTTQKEYLLSALKFYKENGLYTKD